jgi:type I restriction enzyme R subunit
VVVNPKSKQADLDAALGPVSSRLLVQFKQARTAHQNEPQGAKAHQHAKDEMEALLLFKKDLGTYIRAYEFLGQMFDYGNTDYEKLYQFAKLLLPLLDYGREREGVDLSALKLTHHKMRDLGQQKLNLGGADPPVVPLTPVTETGSGEVQDKHKMRLAEIIQAMNDLFEGVTDGDAVTYVEGVIKTKLLESGALQAQAMVNTKEQFANSPRLQDELLQAIIDAMSAHQAMSKQALGSERVQSGILSTLLGPGALWETLRSLGAIGHSSAA